MSSMMPLSGPTETLTVDLAAIRQDPSWPVDPELVTSFRASIRRGEPPLLDLSLNRVRHADGASDSDDSQSAVGTLEVLEIIDGMHRLEALRLEGVTSHSAKVREYSAQDAFYARIATSLGKPNDLFRQRAERALREGFIRDVAAHIEGAIVYQHGLTDDGTRQPTPRREPLPADPLLALGTILWVHFAAKPDVTEDWERFVLAWLDDIARRLGKTPAWLRDEVLHITALLGDDLPGKPTAERARLLLAIPDDGIMRLALARMKAEPKLSTTDLRFALDTLGCGPDVGRHSWLKTRKLSEMRSMLAHASLSQLARDYTAALARAEAASRLVKTSPAPPQPPAPTTSEPNGLAPNSHPPSTQPLAVGMDSDAIHRTEEHTIPEGQAKPVERNLVFGVVSARFGRTDAHTTPGVTAPGAIQRTIVPGTSPSAGSTSASAGDPFLSARQLMDALVSAWQAFDEQGGNWARPDVRQDLTRLRTLIDGYLTRGASPAPHDPAS